MRSEHGNSLHFISSAIDFLYNNFPKSLFSTTTSQKKVDFLYTNIPKKKPVFRKKSKKIAPQNPGLALDRGANLPTLLYQRLVCVCVCVCARAPEYASMFVWAPGPNLLFWRTHFLSLICFTFTKDNAAGAEGKINFFMLFF